jgi:hypothetical protein
MKSFITILLLVAAAVSGKEESDHHRVIEDNGGQREEVGRWKCYQAKAVTSDVIDKVAGAGREYSLTAD